MRTYLDFEKPVADLQGKVQELRSLGDDGDAIAIEDEIGRLETQGEPGARRDLRQADALAENAGRAPSRPAALPRLRQAADRRLHAARRRPQIRRGCRRWWPGIGRFRRPRRSRSSATRRAATPKAGSGTISAWRGRRATARRSGSWNWPTASALPVIALVDTAGAYPGIGAEERGQAEAIARSTEACLGADGAQRRRRHRRGRLGRRDRDRHRQQGADAGTRDLHRDLAGGRGLDPLARFHRAQDAATNMKITAQDLRRFGVIDAIIDEPVGGAHRAPEETIECGSAMRWRPPSPTWTELPPDEIRRHRRDKYLAIGRFFEPKARPRGSSV